MNKFLLFVIYNKDDDDGSENLIVVVLEKKYEKVNGKVQCEKSHAKKIQLPLNVSSVKIKFITSYALFLSFFFRLMFYVNGNLFLLL